MSLSAIDCIGRGIANVRANWELVLLQLTQVIACSFLVGIGLVGCALLVGASALLEMSGLADWPAVAERLGGLTSNVGLLAIGLAAVFILIALVALLYAWFQAGIFAVLDHGERQAPPIRQADQALFRTFTGRYFRGWAGHGAWRYFGFFCWAALWSVVLMGLYAAVLVVVFGLGGSALENAGGFGLVGCLAVVPFILLALALNLWAALAMALLPRPGFGVWRATTVALSILGRRLGGTLLIFAFFIIASFGVALVFLPLTQGMALAVDASAGAGLVVQLLLGSAQWLVNALLTLVYFASLVALARTQLDGKAA